VSWTFSPFSQVSDTLGVWPSATPGKATADSTIDATTIQPTRRKVAARRRAVGGEAFIDLVPERAAGSAADDSTSVGPRRGVLMATSRTTT
jgi:hypothetical protein